METAPSTDNQIKSLDAVETVIDMDFHLTEQQSDFIDYIEDPYRSMIFNGSVDKPNHSYLSSFYPSAGLFATGVVSGKINNPVVNTKSAVKEGMELINSDRIHADPTLNLYLGIVHHDELAASLAHAYNSWALDKIYDAKAGIYGPVVVAPQKPNLAAMEIDERKHENEIVSVFIPSGGIHPPLGNEQYWQIYEAAENAGLPVVLHNASGTQIGNFPLQFHGTNRYFSNHVPTHAMTHMMHLTDMITRGVPVRFSKLNFVIQEAGLGWIPYLMRRMDNEYAEKREDIPMLEQAPSEYIHDQFYFTSQPIEGAKDRDYINSIIRLLGPKNLMFSSDYPHLDFDHSSELLRGLRNQFTNKEINDIYGGTAKKIFKF